MKMNLKILLLLLLAIAVPFTIASGQENKNEKKIKIVIDDGSGEKTVLDTTITDGTIPGTITTKDGKIIIIDEPVSHPEQGKGEKMMHVTVTDNTGGKNEETEKIIIMSGDGETWTTSATGDKEGTLTNEADGKVYVITKTKSVENDSDGKKVKIITESGDKETETGATKYIIAKDGIVVTVESDNAAKAKELIKEIENKLGVEK
jgi:hypothetical protein